MRKLHAITGVGVLLCSLFCSGTSKAELICIHPVPLTIKELVDKQKANLISEEVLKLNIDYLTLKYCAAATINDLTAVSSVPLGDGCEMKSGNRLGELVYWTTCNADQNIETGKGKGKEKSGAGSDSIKSLVECCLAYCRAVKCNSPPATTACSPSYLTSILTKYSDAFPNPTAYKQNLYAGAKSYNGTILGACR
jgi:hypothetical protein